MNQLTLIFGFVVKNVVKNSISTNLLLDLLAVIGNFFSPHEAPLRFSRVDFAGIAWIAETHWGGEVDPHGDFEEVLNDWNLGILVLSWKQQDDEEGDHT